MERGESWLQMEKEGAMGHGGSEESAGRREKDKEKVRDRTGKVDRGEKEEARGLRRERRWYGEKEKGKSWLERRGGGQVKGEG